MNTKRISSDGSALLRRLRLGLAAFAGAMALGSCTNPPQATEPTAAIEPASKAEQVMDPANIAVTAPGPGETRRVGGDLAVRVAGNDGDFRAGPCRIDTPLPVGYPAPTPPGAIDIKTYPGVRRAEVVGKRDPDSGMNSAFWPLFNHIKKHDIAMTSPVEMDYRDLKPGGNAAGAESGDWSMAFLYRTADLNATGTEGNVIVRDAEPVTVVSIGMKGNYSMELVEQGMTKLEAWLAENPQWKAEGNWRTLYYNGPALLFWNKWAEVQIPVKPAGTSPTPPG